MIVVDGITKSYPLLGFRRHYVFRDLHMTIPDKRSVGIVGRNGSGKTTFLRLIGGVDQPDRGRVTITNEGTISPPLGVSTGTAGNITGRANAKFVCRIHGDDDYTMRLRLEWIERFAEIGEFFDLPLSFYSGGMRSRLTFGIAMAFDYDYYLIDELSSAGDQVFRSKASRTFRAKRGKAAVIMISHNLRSLQEECDSGIYVRKGEALWFDDIRDALKLYAEEEGVDVPLVGEKKK
ncbi:MAG: transporter ATP-binding protein [Hydrocarboniphaga sp.]|uniref:ABC transporter ATP-binding protein n=1 Tax=Hydrocarboniphaga sp. TaxID=2033016 RepID=UPI00260D4DFC|nr:ATP-binding cassette domain-containing protein [Hydrocarboniphaga sp.]MDB5972491.1 transporter ATP-binding protein [Hydrocarboniphaga sp.]